MKTKSLPRSLWISAGWGVLIAIACCLAGSPPADAGQADAGQADAGQAHSVAARAAADSLSADEAVSTLPGSAERASASSVGSLSVAPAGELRYPEDRPAWIDAAPSLSGAVHRWPVSSSASSTVELSRRALEAQLRAAAETYVETLLESPRAPSVIGLDDRWISARLAPDRSYEGELWAGDELRYEAAAELWFDPASRDWIRSRWAAHQVGRRMLGLGAMTFGATVLLLLSTAGLSLVARRAERRGRHAEAAIA